MDVHSNAAVSGGLPEDFLLGNNMEGGDDVSLEWLSIFVEDCLSGSGFTSQVPPLPTPTATNNHHQATTSCTQMTHAAAQASLSVVPSKARSKRRKVVVAPKPKAAAGNHHTFHVNHNHSPAADSPLLPQTYWLAESELLIIPPKKVDDSHQDTSSRPPKVEESEPGDYENQVGEQQEELAEGKGDDDVIMVMMMSSQGGGGLQQQPRRCTHCLSQKTPQWRAGPLGPKTLCNACGVRFKSGRLLPEYRPAKSPTFESYKHSNSHKKVMEMRMAILSAAPSHTYPTS